MAKLAINLRHLAIVEISMRMRQALTMISALTFLVVGFAKAETVDVKYQGRVSLHTFDCAPTKPSSLVKRLCFDEARSYLLVDLTGTFYHYCAVDPETVSEWRSASSLGRFYNDNIKGGQFDCRVQGVPD
ncbi:KTSC domain-containing protein [Pseudotabrizicola sediminis]|uniref:KTSC domain-containing protein n=1 Tax=Pseudotabrizicola sediminis TaxID=2486418 RepID=UPI001AEC08B1|nr:KTSC domain-containing protein [Pseudotabrizicola sediminis]